MNRDPTGIGGLFGDVERIANPKTEPERLGENDLHGQSPNDE
jgi:hypothetical protein